MNIQTELRVPDLWYDFYARLVPGAAFVAAVRLLLLDTWAVPDTAWEILVLAFAGYFCALVTQPFASRLAGVVERLAEKRLKQHRDFVLKRQVQLGAGTREMMILAKMHGEVSFFCQLSVLSVVLLAININHMWPTFDLPKAGWIAIPALCCAALAYEVAERRVGKADQYIAYLGDEERHRSAKL